jgi:glutaminyl-peptide cyclotransferase
MDDITRQCAFGPRVPGTAAHDSCFAFLVGELRASASGAVETDTFSYDSPELKRTVTLMNAVAHFNPKSTQRVLFGAHWDSRPWADRDPDPKRQNRPVLGANDGASGVAVLLELARELRKRDLQLGVDLALFDGEDLGTQENPSGFFRGSNRYVEWKSGEKPPLFVVVLDMVGEKDAVFHWEGNSAKLAMNIVDVVWGEARSLGITNFRSDVKYTIYDDHIPFLDAGIPAIDVIDFDFPQWHTTHDTPDVCSAETLEAVGRVVLTLVTRPNFLSR